MISFLIAMGYILAVGWSMLGTVYFFCTWADYEPIKGARFVVLTIMSGPFMWFVVPCYVIFSPGWRYLDGWIAKGNTM